MKSRWKRVFLWSSLGGLALGTSMALTRRGRKTRLSPVFYEEIPPQCQRVFLRTELYEITEGGEIVSAHDEYLLQATPFKVWSVLELPASGDVLRGDGASIFHVTVSRHRGAVPARRSRQKESEKEQFYGIIVPSSPAARMYGSSRIARGQFLRISKCYVGGAANGVESGEIHQSRGRILNYRFEYTPRPDLAEQLKNLDREPRTPEHG